MTETLCIWIGAFITLCCFSFLWKDNPLYRFTESLFVGVSAGYYLSVVSFHQVLKPNLLAKLFPSFFTSPDSFSNSIVTLVPSLNLSKSDTLTVAYTVLKL